MRKQNVWSLGALVVAGVLGMTGCVLSGPVSEEQDVSGLTEVEVAEMTLEEQYARAGEQYVELNELFGELQAEIFADEWREGGTRSEVVPGQGYVRVDKLRSDDRENSYYFPVSRWHPVEGDFATLMQEIAERWELRGWEVGSSVSSVDGSERVVATTEDGYWFEADELGDELELSGHSPVYWGESLPLVVAIGDRRDAERLAGHPWYDIERDEDNTVMRLPGVYRPFPAWETIPESLSAP